MVNQEISLFVCMGLFEKIFCRHLTLTFGYIRCPGSGEDQCFSRHWPSKSSIHPQGDPLIRIATVKFLVVKDVKGKKWGKGSRIVGVLVQDHPDIGNLLRHEFVCVDPFLHKQFVEVHCRIDTLAPAHNHRLAQIRN